jgi:predicted nuclease of predicted toxin-antitoxin system
MGVDIRIVEWLKAQGHDAIHLRDEGLQRMPDPDIFAKAISENRVILTFDLDFSEIAALSEEKKTSVVLFRLRNARRLNVIDRLSSVLAESPDALLKGAVVVVEQSRHRVRYLPVGESPPRI